MLDCLAVASLLLTSVWLKFVLELRLGYLVEFLLWSANIVFSDLISRASFSTVPFRFVARFLLALAYVPFSLRCALLARLLVHNVSVSSRVVRSTSRVSLISLCIERIAFSAPLLFLSGTMCSTTFSALWAVCFTDYLQCALFGVFCVGFNLRGFDLFRVCI